MKEFEKSFRFPSVGFEEDLQTQLIECRAQLEHWQGVAKICELSKGEELQELQKQCDQEIQSLQEALRGKMSVMYSERRSRLLMMVQSCLEEPQPSCNLFYIYNGRKGFVTMQSSVP